MPLTGVWNGAVQTRYDTHPNQGVAGQLTHLNLPHDYIGCPVQSPFIACGRAVAKGDIITNVVDRWSTTVAPYKLLARSATTTAENVVGILIRDASAENGPEMAMVGNEPDFAVGYRQGRYASICRLGYIHVKNYADTTEGAPAFMVINATNALNAAIGDFVTTDLSGAAIEVPGITWYASDLHSMNETSVVKVNLVF